MKSVCSPRLFAHPPARLPVLLRLPALAPMKPNTLRWMGVSAAVAAAVVCWYLLSTEPDSASRTAGKGLARATHMSGNPSASKPAGPLPKFGTPEFKRTLFERGQKWLDSRGRDAAGLLAVWNLTGDKAFLDEAADKFPNDPRVCMEMIQRGGSRKGLLPWIERLIAAQPLNPEGLYQKARILQLGGDRAGAIAALRQAAVMSGRREDHLVERIQTIHCFMSHGEERARTMLLQLAEEDKLEEPLR